MAMPELEGSDLDALQEVADSEIRVIAIWEVIYEDDRRRYDSEGTSSMALFTSETRARGFAIHCRKVTSVTSRFVTTHEFAELRKRHLL